MSAKARSLDQHKRFFAVIAATYHHWPEAHPFQPDTAEHLRAWLLVQAGHSTIKTFRFDGDAGQVAALIPIITATMLGKHSWCDAVGHDLHVRVPQSIAFSAVSHAEFCKINDAVDEIIRAETGLDPDRLLAEKAA